MKDRLDDDIAVLLKRWRDSVAEETVSYNEFRTRKVHEADLRIGRCECSELNMHFGDSTQIECANCGRQVMLVGMTSSHTEKLLHEAMKAMKVGDHASAERLMLDALEDDPNFGNTHYQLCELYLQQGRFDEALTHAELAVRDDPLDVDAIGNKGSALANLDKTEEARREFYRAVALIDDFPMGWYNVGLAELRLNNRVQAAQAWSRVIELDGQGKLGQQVAQLLTQTGLDRELQTKGNFKHWLEMRDVLRKEEDSYQAFRTFKAGESQLKVGLCPNKCDEQGFVFIGEKNKMNCKECGREVELRGPTSARCLALVSEARELLEIEPEEAVALLEQALEEDPKYGDTHYMLCEHYLMIGKYPKALHHAKKILMYDEHDVDAMERKGAALSMLNRTEEALEAFEQCVEKFDDFARGWYNLGMAHLQLDNREAAIRALKTASSADAHGQYGNAARQTLQEHGI